MERYYNFGGEGDRSRRPRVGARAVLEVNAPVIDHPGSTEGALDRALLVEPMRRWRERICAARRPHRHAERRDPAAGTRRRERSCELEWGADTDRFQPGAAGPAAVRRGRRRPSRSSPARSAAGTAPSTSCARSARCAARGRTDIGAVFIGDGPELPARRRTKPPASTASSSPAPCRTTDDARVPGRRRHRRRAVRHRRARAAVARVLLVAAQDLRVHGRRPAVVAPAVDRIPSLVADGREGAPLRPDAARRPGRALETLADPAVRRPLGRAARERAVRDYSWKAHCEALDARSGRSGERDSQRRRQRDSGEPSVGFGRLEHANCHAVAQDDS